MAFKRFKHKIPFDYAQGDCQTERSPRLNGRAGKFGFTNNATLNYQLIKQIELK